MTRDQMIEILVEDWLTEWVYAQNTDSLVEVLYLGWKGYEDYSDEGIEEQISYLDEDMIENYLESSKKRLAEQKKRFQKEVASTEIMF